MENLISLLSTIDWLDQFIIPLFATLIGVLAGFLLAILGNKRFKKSELKQTQKNLVKSLIAELNDMKKVLEKDRDTNPIKWKEAEHEFSGHYFTISFSSFDNAINSGELSLLPPDLQVKLSHINNKFQDYSKLIDQILTFHTTAVFASNLATKTANVLVKNVNSRFDSIKNDIEEFVPKLSVVLEE